MIPARHDIALCGLALLALCACDSPKPAPAAAVTVKQPAKAAAADAAASAAPAAPPYVYVYNPMGKRDPFRSPEVERPGTGNGAEGPCTEPLCQWDLDQLHLVAVVTGDANPFAMVEDPQGRGFVIRRNTKIGKQGGKVTQILRDSVIVTEYWTAPDGKLNPNQANLTLPPDRQEVPAMDLQTGQVYQ